MTKQSNLSIELTALKTYVKRNDEDKVKVIVSSYHPFDISQAIIGWEIEEKIDFIRMIDKDLSSEIILELPDEDQEFILTQLKDKEVDDIVSELEADDIVELLDDMDQEVSKKIIRNTDVETRKDLNKILRYAENEAGHHMSLNFISLKETITIKKARDEIKKRINKEDAELAGNVLLVNKENKLVGSVSIEDILSQQDNKRISSFKREITSISPDAPLKEARDLIADYNLDSLPIVSRNQEIIGVIEPEDIVEALAELEEKHLSFVKSSSRIKRGKRIKEYKPYGELTSMDIFNSRIFWIITLLFVGLVTQVIIMGFQQIWTSTGHWTGGAMGSSIAALAFSSAISIASSINDSSGNSGSQSTSVLIEAIALGEIKLEDHGKSLRKEVMAGSHVGLAVALGSFIRTYFVWLVFGILSNAAATNAGLSMIEYHKWLFIIASVAAFSFYVSIVFGNFVGSYIPLLGTRKGWKSSVISGPVTTTFVDIFVFAFYLGMTTAVFVPLLNTGVL